MTNLPDKPTWAIAAAKPELMETREVKRTGYKFNCPFCQLEWKIKFMRHAGGHRCTCGALFYSDQALAVHFKERAACPN